jgi:hypothetical protein
MALAEISTVNNDAISNKNIIVSPGTGGSLRRIERTGNSKADQMAISLSLSAGGLSRLPANIYSDDFTFIVDSQRYPCPAIIADFLSPVLSNLHIADPSISEFEIRVSDPDREFANFLSLARGSILSPSVQQMNFYSELSKILGNPELSNALSKALNTEPTVQSSLWQLHSLWHSAQDCTSLIQFVASHFTQFKASDLASICGDLGLIEAVFSDPAFQIQNEDSFFETISVLISTDSNLFPLLESVAVEYLSQSALVNYIQLLSDSFDKFNYSIWERICARLVLSPRSSRPIPQGKADLTEKGIIRFLTEECGGNVCDRGVISVSVAHTGTDYYGGRNGRDPKHVFDLDTNVGWYDGNQNPTWFLVDFQKILVQIKSYTITFGEGQGPSYFPQWVMEGSNDKTEWKLLDDRSHQQVSRMDGERVTFLCNGDKGTSFRYIRLYKKGKFWGRNHYLGMTALEFFGTVLEAPDL